jgi:hypothetical protein
VVNDGLHHLPGFFVGVLAVVQPGIKEDHAPAPFLVVGIHGKRPPDLKGLYTNHISPEAPGEFFCYPKAKNTLCARNKRKKIPLFRRARNRSIKSPLDPREVREIS